MRKILIFGATGNIGAYLADYLNQHLNRDEYEVIAIGRKQTSFFEKTGIHYIRADINKAEDFENLPKDNVFAIVNLAGLLPAYSKEFDPFAYVETNIKGALRILEFARKNEVDRVLYTQTWSVQGGLWGIKEVLSPKDPKSLIYTGDHAFYCITKCMVEDTMEHYKQEYGVKNFVFRLPNVYLYHPAKTYYVDGTERKIGYRYMIDAASKGENIELWGNPEAYKDILYIKDLCQIMLKAILSDISGGTYNVGTGIKTTLREQIEGIIQVFSPKEKRSEIIYRPERAGFTSFIMDIENAKTELGYEPEYTYIKYLEDYKKEQELKRFDHLWLGKI